MKKRVLFLCTSNRCRSQIAEAVVNQDLGDRFEAFSAGTAPKTPHPLALRVLAEIGIELPNARSKHMDEFAGQSFDFVITLCDNANETCPLFLGNARQAHVGFEDPDNTEGTDEEKIAVFRRVRDEIRDKVETFLKQEHDSEAIEIKLELPE